MTAPALLAPLLGYVVDRVPRRTFLVVGQPRAPRSAMLPLLLVHDAGDVWIVYAVAVLLRHLVRRACPAALNGLLKDMLPEDVLVEANASLSVTREALRLVGPLLGATTFARGRRGRGRDGRRRHLPGRRRRRSPALRVSRDGRRRAARAAVAGAPRWSRARTFIRAHAAAAAPHGRARAGAAGDRLRRVRGLRRRRRFRPAGRRSSGRCSPCRASAPSPVGLVASRVVTPVWRSRATVVLGLAVLAARPCAASWSSTHGLGAARRGRRARRRASR